MEINANNYRRIKEMTRKNHPVITCNCTGVNCLTMIDGLTAWKYKIYEFSIFMFKESATSVAAAEQPQCMMKPFLSQTYLRRCANLFNLFCMRICVSLNINSHIIKNFPTLIHSFGYIVNIFEMQQGVSNI